jgi:Flp pilus assembly protein protease CpaA
MSASMYRADRNTHIKVVVVSCLCAIVVVIVGLTARLGDLTVAGTIARVGAPTVVTNATENTIR